MNGNKFLKIVRKYKKCPNCGVGWKTTDLQVELEDEVVHISCKCGFSKFVNEDNEELKQYGL